jgi:hypothetical protein
MYESFARSFAPIRRQSPTPLQPRHGAAYPHTLRRLSKKHNTRWGALSYLQRGSRCLLAEAFDDDALLNFGNAEKACRVETGLFQALEDYYPGNL